MHIIWDRIALAIILMVVVPAAPAIALAWGSWLVHQWIFNGSTEAESSIGRNSSRTALQSPSTSGVNHLRATEFSLAA